MLALLLAAVIGATATAAWISAQWQARHAAELAAQEAAWQQERAALEAAWREAQATSAHRTVAEAAPTANISPARALPLTPEEIVARLRDFKRPGTHPSRALRQVIHDLEELITAGPAALPAIRQFLLRNEDLDFDFAANAGGKGQRGTVPNEFVVPPSLRFALFDVVRQIGGSAADALLGEMLGATGRGVELAWLARVLQERVPDRYRETALTSAREMLARPLAAPGSPLDRNDRDNLYAVLAMYGDTSYVRTAETQLVQADGAVDRSALKYLQQSLGSQAVPVAARSFDDPRITDPANKEPFARLALSYVGVDAQANEFYQRAINDMSLSKSHRKNLIEDLNQDGFVDLKNLGARDLPLIENRIALIEQLAPQATDPANTAAFKEAYKDLINMRARVLAGSSPSP